MALPICPPWHPAPLHRFQDARLPRSRSSLQAAAALRARYRPRDHAAPARCSGRRYPMIGAPSGVKVHIACGVTDMRKGIDGLATLVQEVLLHDPFSGHLFAFRGGTANLIKILYWDGTGLCLFTKRLEHRIFEWPTVGGTGNTVSLTS